MIEIESRVNRLKEKYIAIRRTLHRVPEVAFQEVETTKLIRQELTKSGILEQYSVGDTGVIGVLHGGKTGETIALRADIDALPISETTDLCFASEIENRCHACGHDIHTAALLMAAQILCEQREQLSGTILFIFQPAEERFMGASLVMESGAWNRYAPTMIFGAHVWPDLPAGTIGVRKETMMAGADQFRITIRAPGGHGAHPERTADPIVVAAQTILALQTIISREIVPTEEAVLTIGKVLAGTEANIIPSEAILEGTARIRSADTQKKVRDSIERITKLIAQSMKAEASVTLISSCPPLCSDPKLVDEVMKAASALLGKDNIAFLPEMSMGSEDFAYYLERVPGVFFRIGTGDERPETRLGLHQSGIVFNEEAICVGAKVFCGIVCGRKE